MDKQGIIFCAGEIEGLADFYPQLPLTADALVVCADGGWRHAKALGLQPDLLIGDFDSCEEIPSDVPKLTYPVRKDATDSYLAADYCLEQGCREIWLLGAVGSRWDHSLANFALLKYLHDRSARGILRDCWNEAFLVDSPALLPKREGWYLSLIPFGGDVEEVSISGVSYPTEKAFFPFAGSLGVSNQIEKEAARVAYRGGFLLGFFSRDKKGEKKANLK